ncbi:succinate dehydrogenase assembly factor 2 [Sphingomonas sp.]|uniref:FAD assembly factor SdhE n=1 Tax=Sphingomonas sp. TaxID=28214 RepID=UPI001DC8D765|nr:succinate dehydrogenase assembly factor 2 [Sphingomonas sp.]MBX9797111.1 succinate dehydrogenase assembly factor 2 [Sphingomonas sp.]
MDRETRLKRLRYRAWHRGTKEADLLIGGFFDAAHPGWNDADIAIVEALLEEQDVDIMAWATGMAVPPPAFQGPILAALKVLNYVPIAD